MHSKCYVGGKGLNNSGGRIVDFIAQHKGNVDIVEIEPPTVDLVRRPYRANVYPPSRDLVGACVQVLEYRASFVEHLAGLRIELPELNGPSPRCHVVADNLQKLSRIELRSFELYRHSLSTVRVKTYDELFRDI